MRTTVFSILALAAVLVPSVASADAVSDRAAAVSLCRTQVAQQAGVDLVSVRLTNVRAALRNVRVDLNVSGSHSVRCDVTRGEAGALQVAAITPPIQTASATATPAAQVDRPAPVRLPRRMLFLPGAFVNAKAPFLLRESDGRSPAPRFKRKRMAGVRTLFVSKLYQATLDGAGALNRDLAKSCRVIAGDDEAGQRWSKAHGYKGYTSYSSLDDLPVRDPSFAALKRELDTHAGAFAKALHLDLGGKKLKLDSIWINVLEPGGVHTGHIHPMSVLSGTYYVETPPGSSALKLEDPRLPLMMAAPQRADDAPEEERAFVYVTPKAGDVLMWESYLRHEVPMNAAKRARISVSFNYRR